MVEIYVDGDACPVKEETMRVADRYGVRVHLVSNNWLRVPEHPLLHRVVVGEGLDVADDWIAERIGPNDIAVTADIPLAARALEKGAAVIDHAGKAISRDSIGMKLAMRDLMSHLRDMGEVGGGNAPFSKKDRSRFLSALDQAVVKARRSSPQ